MNLMDALAATRPARLDPDHDPERRNRDIEAAVSQTVATERPHGAVRRRRRIGLALGAIAAAVAVAVPIVVSGTRPNGHPPAPVPRQPAIMLAAAKAEAQPMGRYWYRNLLSEETYVIKAKTGKYAIFADGFEDYSWTAAKPGGDVYYYDRDLPARPQTPADTAAWRAAGSPHRIPIWDVDHYVTRTTSAGRWRATHNTGMPSGRFPFFGFVASSPGKFGATPEELQAISPDPQQLRKRFLKLHGNPPQRLLQVTLDLSDPVPPRLKAGIMRMVPTLPGVYPAGTATDPLGRTGIAYAADWPARTPGHAGYRSRTEVIFSANGDFLAEEEVLTKPGGEYAGMRPGLVLGYRATRGSEWTNTKPSKPPATPPF